MKKFLLIISFCSLVFCVSAINNTHILRTFKTPVYTDEQILSAISQEFSIPKSLSLQPFRDEVDELGIRHISFKQVYNGVEIENAIVLVHCKDGKIASINGSLMQEAPNNDNNRISEDQAIKRVKKTRSQNESAKLLLVEFNGEYRYAYKVESMEEAKTYYIDSETGEIIKTIPYFHNINVTCTGYTLYNGWQGMVCEEINKGYGKYSLEDKTRNIVTADASNLSFSQSDIEKILQNDELCYNILEEAGTLEAFNIAMSNNEQELAANIFRYSLAFYYSDGFFNDEDEWYTPALTSVTITSANSSWWHDFWDTKPDLYIKVYDPLDRLIYISPTKNDATFPVTFTIPNPIKLKYADYKIEFYDEDATTDTYGGSITISTNKKGKYSWGNTSSSTSGNIVISPFPSGEFDVHWGMQKTYDFYSEVLNRKSYDNKGATIYNLVYPPQSAIFPNMPNNASAQYKYQPNFMVYGAGTPGEYNPIVSLDIMSHEFTHLVTANNGNGGLEYVGESGALNESFSDIMAMGVVYTTTGSCPWTIGEGVVVGSKAMRSLANPHLYEQPANYLIDPYWQEITGKPSEENDHDGVHTNSGVQNKWFYILANEIGIQKGIQIAYRNLIYYLSPNANYLDARRGSIQAAIDLYGENSVEVKTVNEAWDAVGVYNFYDKDYTLPSGKYFIVAGDLDRTTWALSSSLTTTSPKRFIAEPFDFDFDFIPRDVIWNVTKNADGTYVFENNGKYMSWTSGNSAEMSLTPKNFNVSFDEKFEGYTISFKASSTNTQILSYNNDNGSRYFAFSGNTNTNHFLMIEDVDDDDIEPIKPPVSKEDDIHKQNNTNKATKCIIDGQLFIIRDGHRYTVTGAKVE